jgi:hypothetical protein
MTTITITPATIMITTITTITITNSTITTTTPYRNFDPHGQWPWPVPREGERWHIRRGFQRALGINVSAAIGRLSATASPALVRRGSHDPAVRPTEGLPAPLVQETPRSSLVRGPETRAQQEGPALPYANGVTDQSPGSRALASAPWEMVADERRNPVGVPQKRCQPALHFV